MALTQVEFHTGLADKTTFACRLLRKAYAQGVKVVVCAAADQLARLDQALWTADAQGFLPHVLQRSGSGSDALRRHTPVWLCTDPADAPHRDVLVNLGPDLVAGFDGFARVVEIVGQETDDAQAGRVRWKHYAAQRLSIRHHTAAN
jgi:DNA polymerase-3 subunit chi